MSDRKTLLPELLPEPRPQFAETPRERVAVRARAMLDRLSGLKTAAGAALLAAHCGGGYGVVDPLPPPPIQCTSNSDPFADLVVSGIAVPSDGGWSNALIMLSSYRTVGYQFNAVRVTAGGTLVAAEDMSQSGAGGGTNFDITIHPDGSGAPLEFEVDLGCGSATATRHYRASFNGTGYTVVDLG
jgi:hypothetical protein